MILLTKNMLTSSKACQKKDIMQISRENENPNAYSTYTWFVFFKKKSYIYKKKEKEKKEYSEKKFYFPYTRKHERKKNVVKNSEKTTKYYKRIKIKNLWKKKIKN